MSWQNEESVYLIKWRSPRSGATLSELKKTETGKDEYISTLKFLGIKDDDIVVTKEDRPWKYVTKKDREK